MVKEYTGVGYKPKGWEIAANIIGKGIRGGDKFLTYYDPDVDGLMAGYLCQRFLKSNGVVSTAYINKDRGHGFKLSESELEQIRGWTVVAVDFAMTRAEIEKVVGRGINLVVIDHHEVGDSFIEVEKDGYRGVLINNQYKEEPERYRFLSGAGMVHHTVMSIKEAMGEKEQDKESEALVGITLLSDVRATESDEARYYLEETFTSEESFIKYLIDLTTTRGGYKTFGVPQMTRNFIDFTLSPKFNALFRLNKGEDAIKLLKQDPSTVRTYRDDGFLDVMRNIQNSITADIIEDLELIELESIIIGKISSEKKVTIISGTDITNFIGLACSRIKGDKGKTTLLYVEDEGILQRGSVRGKYDNVDYLGIFRAAGAQAEGHAPAFGVISLPEGGMDVSALDARVKEAEREAMGEVRERILETKNLSVFSSGPNREIARHNTYVRDINRIYLKYTGPDESIQKKEYNKMDEYTVDGIKVKSFDKGLELKEGIIQPMIDKGDYIEYTLRRVQN